jgi:hypothetical protein
MAIFAGRFGSFAFPGLILSGSWIRFLCFHETSAACRAFSLSAPSSYILARVTLRLLGDDLELNTQRFST